MQRTLREALRLVNREGARNIKIEDGGRHTILAFDSEGKRFRIPIHKGVKLKSYELSRLRSQLRGRAGEKRP
ncbi:hypothetical protein [Chelatococcus asaccharovorans]|uniref:HicA-like toxin of HicAB toxin-antitoxin system n=1 Tax=Chelatococcus asaccharovorans TaxID=28210 RepID=A0A2V3UAQ7_9HYPH|nr:hypothetical protein [Chelatococcus asaccharovorans]MBS7703262.1 hypothetical protein [Chelatococcus asaccharovorans]PXW61593.1 hypothetical protein C7450_103110 [Chelatococcus asaccharovorans]